MDPARFPSDQFGTVQRRPGENWAFYYYLPNQMPRDLILAPETIFALSKADAALGRLSGVGRLLRQPALLVRPYVTREALASSRIEGTVASLSDVLQAEASEEPSNDEDVKEVLNYQAALNRGLEMLGSHHIGIRVVREMHDILLTGVRGQEKLPGEFRKSPVWIGSATDSPDTAALRPAAA